MYLVYRYIFWNLKIGFLEDFCMFIFFYNIMYNYLILECLFYYGEIMYIKMIFIIVILCDIYSLDIYFL